METIYKVCAKRGSSFTLYGEVEYLYQAYWTTIKAEEGLSDSAIKYLAKANLMKQVAIGQFQNIRCWKHIYLDNSDLEIVRA